ncbi:MAG: SDR family NAD(P)-dependent oxidoreductase [Cyanophyceae cyanobacterium]
MASTVLITGASQGIGKATAQLFAERGDNVVLAARNPDPLYAVADSIRAGGQGVLAVPTDVSQAEQVTTLVEKALDTYGHIDVLVNNAGICMNGEMAQTTLEDWRRVIDVNLWGYIYTIHALLPQFLQRKAGTIVNVGSFGGKVPLPKMTAYCTSKFAVTGLTETLRIELEPAGIHVCAVHPSVTNSDFLERTIFRGNNASQQRQQMSELLTSPIASQPEDVAKAILEVVEHPKGEIVVGSAVVPTAAYRLAPGLTQWLMQRTVS